MNYVEMTTDEAIEVLKKSKSKKVLVVVQDLENDDVDAVFVHKLKTDCEIMIREAKTILSACDDFVKQLDLFTEKQRDLINFNKRGFQKTILLN